MAKIFKLYLIVNLTNKMRYIGMTSESLKERFRKHLRESKPTNPQFKVHLKRNYKFKMKCLLTGNRETISTAEYELIEKYNAVKSAKYYNLCKGGYGGSPYKAGQFPKEVLEKMSKLQIGKQAGIKNPAATLTNKIVMNIFNAVGKQRDIAKQFNTSMFTVNAIKTGRKWSSVTNKKFKQQYTWNKLKLSNSKG